MNGNKPQKCRGKKIACAFVGLMVLLSLFPTMSIAATLDFGWGRPFDLNQETRSSYLAWPIQFSNPTNKRLFAEVDVVAVTDTGLQYSALKRFPAHKTLDRYDVHLLRSTIFPAVTQRAIAVFEAIDPEAMALHFYVGGLISVSATEKEDIRYFRVSYKRTATGWEWDGTNTLE